MTQQEKQLALHALVNIESWPLVEEVIQRHIDKVTSTDDVDTSKDAAEVKIELKARRLAKEYIQALLQELKGYGVTNATNPMNRSMK
jgi:hypothetical protein